MCGITGAISLSSNPLQTEHLKSMVDVIAHRGPDDAGYFACQISEGNGASLLHQNFSDQQFHEITPSFPNIDSRQGQSILTSHNWDLFFGHRRLAVIDLSPCGHQPMSDSTGHIWLTYNGEIYNFKEIRKNLENIGYQFRSDTDTEVVVCAYCEWGIEAIHQFNGMFAFALYDNRTKTLYLARDRYGIKPLYYTLTSDLVLVFGSEIKSILQYVQTDPEVDLLALNEYFTFQNILSDRTLFEGIRMVGAGYCFTIDVAQAALKSKKYWDFQFEPNYSLRPGECEDALHQLLVQSVERQCVSDVPVGSYLSGGMDSGSIASIGGSYFGRIHTFTGGFDLTGVSAHELDFDERRPAQLMANLFQTEHFESVIRASDIEFVMPDLTLHLEDPRIGQCYPNYIVAQLAGKFVKVVLSGIGGDELFGGYPWRYAMAMGINTQTYLQNYYQYWQRLVMEKEKSVFYTSKILDWFSQHDIDSKEYTRSVFRNVFPKEISAKTREEQINFSLYFECKTFLHGLLVVEDKVSMAHSLETRVPFLDNDLVDFACQIPVTQKIAGLYNLEVFDQNVDRSHPIYLKTDVGKNVLRKAMKRIIPQTIIKAKKQGFSAPDATWFRRQNRNYVEDLLLSDTTRINRYLDLEYIRSIIEQHNSGLENKRLLIWSLLSFEWWLRSFQE